MSDNAAEKATIRSLSGVEWSEVHETFGSGMALWQDLDGLHVEDVPENCPPTSFMWLESGDGTVLARLRLDPSSARPVVAGAVLRLDSDVSDEDVVVGVQSYRDVEGWGQDEKRVSRRSAEMSAGRWTIFETVEPTPLQFVRVQRDRA